MLRLTFVINPEDKVGICLCLIDYTLFPSSNLQTVNCKCGGREDETRDFSHAANANACLLKATGRVG